MIGVGVGAGAYILSKFTVGLDTCVNVLPEESVGQFMVSFPPQLANPESVEGLVLVNIDTDGRGWIDWAAQKVKGNRICPICLIVSLGLKCFLILGSKVTI